MKLEGDYIVFNADEARVIVQTAVEGDERRLPDEEWSAVGVFVRLYNPVPSWQGRRPLHLCSEEMKRLAGVHQEFNHFL